MKKLIILSVLLAAIFSTTFAQEASFKSDDFKEFVGQKIKVTFKDYALSENFGDSFFLTEVTDTYLVCTYWKNNDNYKVFILIEEIAGFWVKKPKALPLR